MNTLQRILATLLFATPLTACTLTPAAIDPQPSGGRAITADQIRQSGARTAWQVLERQPGLLRIGTNLAGQVSASSYRAVPGTAASGAPLLVVDGVETVDLGMLRQIPAERVQSMVFFNGSSAPGYHGPRGANGVLVVRTAPPVH
ncbi:MAG TPA: TonB-dependent receptor plug domain-containing protein [Gemmatimonadales bacterium]|nr:TonB-dependent receptor plug domain-containing protein [Gemmatimonadales bacterium]